MYRFEIKGTINDHGSLVSANTGTITDWVKKNKWVFRRITSFSHVILPDFGRFNSLQLYIEQLRYILVLKTELIQYLKTVKSSIYEKARP